MRSKNVTISLLDIDLFRCVGEGSELNLNKVIVTTKIYNKKTNNQYIIKTIIIIHLIPLIIMLRSVTCNNHCGLVDE